MSLAKSPALQQLPLREMKPGLAKPIATLSLEPEDLTARLGIVFDTAHDDLDEMQTALLVGATGHQFALVRHLRQPAPGTDILTDEQSPDLTADLYEILSLLSCDESELQWIHPEVGRDYPKFPQA